MLSPTPDNLRSEIARHRITRSEICRRIGMHENALTMLVNGVRPLSDWAGHNIAWAVNQITGLAIFNVDMKLGPVLAPRGRPQNASVLLPLPPRKRRKRRQRASQF